MGSARIGAGASNVIPATAVASIDMRLVKGMDHEQTAERLIDHIRRRGYFVVDHEPSPQERMLHAKVAKVVVEDGGYNAIRTSMDLPISQEIIRTTVAARGPTVLLPTSGGSDPREVIARTLGSLTIGIPTANHDDNQHSFNENLRIQNLWDGIELMAALLAMNSAHQAAACAIIVFEEDRNELETICSLGPWISVARGGCRCAPAAPGGSQRVY